MNVKVQISIYLARKSLAVSDNSAGISGGCLSLPSLNISAC